MSSRCSSSTCLIGNCQGCKDGSKFCNDPRCFPNCPDCSDETKLECFGVRNGWYCTLIIIIGVLVLFILILFIVMYRSPKDVQNNQIYQLGNYQNQINPNQPITSSINQNLPNKINPNLNENLDASLNVSDLPNIHQHFDENLDASLNVSDLPNPHQHFDENLDGSLNVLDLPNSVYSPNPVAQDVFVTSIPVIPSISITSPANVSVASTKSVVQSVHIGKDNDIIGGFN